MKKVISVISAFMGLAIIFAACSKDSYADKLEKEEKAIKQYIKEQGFIIRSDYPASRVFADKEYFKDTDTGIYIHVIDSGNKDKIKKGDKVYMRFYDTRFFMSAPDSIYSNDRPNNDEFAAMNFTYGNSGSYISSDYSSLGGYYMYMFLSPGCARPLDFNLGDKAEVSILVPFANGSYDQQYYRYEPILFGRLKYTK
ncbi:MAG: DUF4827 domain-containing protein [Prevotella sp.]|jgi:hypothetical protein|nr:DUF4827 domain-containing protein [Prevotella sp.]